MNKVTLYGHLGADPELNATSGGHSVLKFRVATNEKVKKGHEWADHTEWHNITVWGKRAEALAKILQKGTGVLVEGALRTTKYEKDGETRYFTSIGATDVRVTGGGARKDLKPKTSSNEFEDTPLDGDDIPF